jgi:hypothetical protein
MSNLAIKLNEDNLFNRLSQLTAKELAGLFLMKLSETDERLEKNSMLIESRFSLNEIKQENQEKELNLIKTKINRLNAEGYFNLTNLGMQFTPQISNQALSKLLKFFKMTKFNNTTKTYDPIQDMLYKDYARESIILDFNDKERRTYTWNFEKVNNYFEMRFKKANVLDTFKNQITSLERNTWIYENFSNL